MLNPHFVRLGHTSLHLMVIKKEQGSGGGAWWGEGLVGEGLVGEGLCGGGAWGRGL